MKTRVNATDPVGLVALTCIWKNPAGCACWLVIPSQYGASRCRYGVLTQHASPRGSEPGWVIFHIRDMILDMSLTGLYVSLSVFLVTIMQRQ